jgi:DNA-binding beta-propeller fold protein YncE
MADRSALLRDSDIRSAIATALLREAVLNAVSVTDPFDNKLIRRHSARDPLPANLSPLYRGQLLVHGLGFSPDHQTIAVVAIGLKCRELHRHRDQLGQASLTSGRSPHEAFFTPDGKEVWVVVRGENYVAVLDGATYEEKAPDHCCKRSEA